MEKKRKSFAYLTTKVYRGDKSAGIHFSPKQKNDVIKFVCAVLQAFDYGKGVDITAFTYKKLRNGLTRLTVTAPK